MSKATEAMIKARWKGHGKDWPAGTRACTKCEKIKPFDQFHKHKDCLYGVNTVCKECRRDISIEQHKNIPLEVKLYHAAKRRAKRKGLDFNIEVSDIIIPNKCPVLGVELKPKTEHAPSLDRIDPTKGYIKGNVQVISKKVNALKKNLTFSEIEKLYLYMKNNLCPAGHCEL